MPELVIATPLEKVKAWAIAIIALAVLGFAGYGIYILTQNAKISAQLETKIEKQEIKIDGVKDENKKLWEERVVFVERMAEKDKAIVEKEREIATIKTKYEKLRKDQVKPLSKAEQDAFFERRGIPTTDGQAAPKKVPVTSVTQPGLPPLPVAPKPVAVTQPESKPVGSTYQPDGGRLFTSDDMVKLQDVLLDCDETSELYGNCLETNGILKSELADAKQVIRLDEQQIKNDEKIDALRMEQVELLKKDVVSLNRDIKNEKLKKWLYFAGGIVGGFLGGHASAGH